MSTTDLVSWWNAYQPAYIRDFPPALPHPRSVGGADITFDWIGAAWNASFATNPLWAACLRQATLEPAFRRTFPQPPAPKVKDQEKTDLDDKGTTAEKKLDAATKIVLCSDVGDDKDVDQPSPTEYFAKASQYILNTYPVIQGQETRLFLRACIELASLQKTTVKNRTIAKDKYENLLKNPPQMKARDFLAWALDGISCFLLMPHDYSDATVRKSLRDLLKHSILGAYRFLEEFGDGSSDSSVGSFFANTRTQCDGAAATVAAAMGKFEKMSEEARRAGTFSELDQLFAQTMTAVSSGLAAQQVMFNLWWLGDATVSARLKVAAAELASWLVETTKYSDKSCVAVVKCCSGVLNDVKHSLEALWNSSYDLPDLQTASDGRTGMPRDNLPKFLQWADSTLESIQHARIRIANKSIPGWEEPGQSKQSQEPSYPARKEPVPIDPRWNVLLK